ncbi:MAG: hypothetical protein AAFR38_10750 [Planctomycetota bacterium]
MKAIRGFLGVSTVVIYVMTALAITSDGVNWPAVAVRDILALNWRSQFNTDFLIYLILVASWISWREGFTPKGHAFGFLSVVMGGMFSFPYLLYATYAASGDLKRVLLGAHWDSARETSRG